MKAEELRIGNWVDGGVNGNLYYQIKVSDFVNTDFSRTKPIELTPEILEKAGFIWIEVKEYPGSWLISPDMPAGLWIGFYKGDIDKMSLLQRELPFDSGNKKYMHFGSNHPEYLHQLQNIFYSIAGTELNIEL